MTAFTPCSPPFRTSPARPFTAASSAMASPDCPRSRATSPPRRSSSPTPSATSTSCIAEVSTEEGKLRLFVAIDRTSKFAFAKLVGSAGKMEAADFLRELVNAVPYRIHTVLTV